MEPQDPNEDEMPKLSLAEENEFKKIKLSLECGAQFFNNSKSKMPPEVESQFLDYISNFEEAMKNAKRVSIFEKLGKPDFKSANSLSDSEIETELQRLLNLMQENNLSLDVLGEYENEDRLIYAFITEELFLEEVDDVAIPGMISHFIYEEFHQNHQYDLEEATSDFLNSFFDKEDEFYEKHHATETENCEELNDFRALFTKFKIKHFEIKEVVFDETAAKVTFDLDFWGKRIDADYKTYFSGGGTMTFEYKYGYWYVKTVNLPAED